AFLARHADARAASLPEIHGHPSGAGRQRLPGEDGMDGFFYARLEKTTL
ncbi:MAG TPA: 16S rRNA (cytosine(967)-C(5))-methyltransferase, partial [Arenimonas sp.]|nr:16S rRNA (cytosine(967)-C(5))-methyltransferase [Arenimonas sp.]